MCETERLCVGITLQGSFAAHPIALGGGPVEIFDDPRKAEDFLTGLMDGHRLPADVSATLSIINLNDCDPTAVVAI